MNCPGCKSEISEKDLVCPHCKKILKLQCNVCGAITKKSICEKCGNVIINKCHKCGKLNPTTLENCPKCGLNINASIGLRESLIDEFAVLTVDVKNFDEIKSAFKSQKILEKFKTNLYELIKNTALRKKLRVQFVEDTFIIRFCKDFSFIESAFSAIDFSIYIAQTVTEINKKLLDAKGIALKAQMSIQKRDIYSKPEEYKSGLNINVVYSSNKKADILNNIELIVDSYIYQCTKTKFPYQSLSAVFLKNKMVMFFELILSKILKTEREKEETPKNIQLPKNIDFEPTEEVDEMQLINFSGLHCTFLKSKNENLIKEITKIREKGITNPIVSVKCPLKYGKLSLISKEDIKEIYSDYEIIRFSADKDNKLTPFGLMKQLICAYRKIHYLDIQLNPQFIEAISADSKIQSLFKMQPDGTSHPEDMRYGYFEAFINFFRAIPYKTIFIIDDFENSDEGSLEILKYLIEERQPENLGFIVSCDENYSLHRKIYKLMTANNYFEIEIKPTSNKNIVTQNIQRISKIQKSFFFEKILENTKGSEFYFEQAIDYLIDNSILKEKDNVLSISKEKMLVLPKTINELAEKRIETLKNTQGAYELFCSMLMCGEKLPFSIVQLLGIKNDVKALKYLEQNRFIKIIEDKEIKIKNYNLFRTSFLNSVEKDTLKEISQKLIEQIYINIMQPDKTKAELLEFAGYKKEAFAQWHSLAMISSQIGDFCTYLNCTNKFLSLVENVIDSQTDANVEKIKMDVYAELATMLYKYYPEKILTFLEMLLENVEASGDDAKIKEVANKLVQSCLMSGNYANALEYIGKIISRTQRCSFNPKEKDFSYTYFLINLVTLEIYYNLGRLNECIDLSDEIFEFADFNQLLVIAPNEEVSKGQFEESMYDALFFTTISRIVQLKRNRAEKIEELCSYMPKKYTSFRLLKLLNDYTQDINIIEPMKKIAQEGLHDKYSLVLFPILQGLIALRYRDWNNLANYIYNAKIQSVLLNLHQVESFCDLMIGYAYLNLGNTKKAKQIFYSILDSSSDSGLKNITYISWLFIAKAEYADKNIDTSISIINNSIVNIENDPNVSELFILLFKSFSAEITLTQGQIEQSMFCAEQAFDICCTENLNIYIPHIANILSFIYNQIVTTNTQQEIVEKYKEKFNKVQEKLKELSQQAN